ncbi:MAG: ammonia channel protein, partial [Hydrogenophaga sp.]|nr:ammonia channel protein [Hydrogenophaga sp.]
MKKLLATLLLGVGLAFGGLNAVAQTTTEAPAAVAAPAADAAAAPAAPAADAAAAPAAAVAAEAPAAAAPAEAPAAEAEAAPAPTPNKGDTAWMMVSTLLVILMTVPGLALFYGGLVRSKNMLS